MSETRQPEPVKVIMSLIFSTRDALVPVMADLNKELGGNDYISDILNFSYTDYYEKEMGAFLERRFVSYKCLVCPDALPDIKAFTNRIEVKYSAGGKRCINIDPGYLSRSQLILATGKGFSHRPYLKNGIYADLTLMFSGGKFQKLEWTYPDYANEKTIKILTLLRKLYIRQLKESECIGETKS